MGCDLFEIGIREAQTGRMMNRTWSRERVLESLPALKRMNALGNDIYVRPAAELGRHGLVLVDDLERSTLRKLDRDGLSPAVLVETSPGNFQAWIRVPDRASDRERGEIARGLTREYNADPASASDRHYGRLAGFTNRKDIYRDRDGLQPFALLRGAHGREAAGGELVLRQAERELRRRARSLDQARSRDLSRSHRPPTQAIEREAEAAYSKYMTDLRPAYRDLSYLDFVAARRLLELGYQRGAIAFAIRELSPDLAERKRGRVDDYVHRTIKAAVLAQEREREREQARGLER